MRSPVNAPDGTARRPCRHTLHDAHRVAACQNFTGIDFISITTTISAPFASLRWVRVAGIKSARCGCPAAPCGAVFAPGRRSYSDGAWCRSGPRSGDRGRRTEDRRVQGAVASPPHPIQAHLIPMQQESLRPLQFRGQKTEDGGQMSAGCVRLRTHRTGQCEGLAGTHCMMPIVWQPAGISQISIPFQVPLANRCTEKRVNS